MTGTRLNAADLIHTGIATHYIDSEKLVNLEGELENIPVDPAESRKQIKNILDRYQSISSKPDDSNSAIAANAILINKCFGEQSKSVEEIIKKLSDESSTGNEWASKTLKVIFCNSKSLNVKSDKSLIRCLPSRAYKRCHQLV